MNRKTKLAGLLCTLLLLIPAIEAATLSVCQSGSCSSTTNIGRNHIRTGKRHRMVTDGLT